MPSSVVSPSLTMAGIPEIAENEFPQAPPSERVMPLPFMKRFCFVPVADQDETVTVAMADPMDFNTREAIMSAYGKSVKVVKGEREAISQYIYRWYEAEAGRRV